MEEFKKALAQFIAAAQKLDAAWPDDIVLGYPEYLPSFDEFIGDMMEFQEKNEA